MRAYFTFCAAALALQRVQQAQEEEARTKQHAASEAEERREQEKAAREAEVQAQQHAARKAEAQAKEQAAKVAAAQKAAEQSARDQEEKASKGAAGLCIRLKHTHSKSRARITISAALLMHAIVQSTHTAIARTDTKIGRIRTQLRARDANTSALPCADALVSSAPTVLS